MADLQQAKVKGVVDIVFLLDATGSMQPCIDSLKSNIKLFIDTLTTKDANNSSPVKDWRAKVVGYRDVEVDEKWFEDAPFVRDVATLKAQLDALTANGGGDEPESLLDALYKLSTLGQTDKGAQEDDPRKWRYRSTAARVIVVFTDASYKEKLGLPEAKGGTLDDVINALQTNKIILSIFAPQFDCYNKLAEIDKSEYQPVGEPGNPKALDEFTKDQNNFRETMKQLARSVSKSAEVEVL
jgi:hypothetical protein